MLKFNKDKMKNLCFWNNVQHWHQIIYCADSSSAGERDHFNTNTDYLADCNILWLDMQ